MDHSASPPAEFASPANRYTLFVYTEEERGNQLVESPVLGMLSDISGSEKFIVVQDPASGVKFIYRIQHDSRNLDAAAITDQTAESFDGRASVQINAMTYRLGTPENAMKLLRGRDQWVQDKGAVLSVLLQNAASRRTRFTPPAIERTRLKAVPTGVPVEHLPSSWNIV